MIKTHDALSNSYIQTFYPFLISSCFTTLGIWKCEPRLTQSATGVIVKREALGERRPPWPRQIITPILPNVKTLRLGGERLTPKVLDLYMYHGLVMLTLLSWFFCSFTHLRIPRSPPKFNQFFIALLRTPT